VAHLLIRHKVKDYAAWKATFDEFIETRRAGGEKSWQIWHPQDDPSNLVVLFEWDSIGNARAFLANPDLKGAMEAGGVVEPPEAYFLEEYDRGTL
jgi:hypothetical protein